MSVKTKAMRQLASSFSRIHQLLHLNTINLTFCQKSNRRINYNGKAHLSRLALQASIIGALADSFSVRVPSKLTSLSLHNLRTSDLGPLDTPPFKNVLTNLRRLQLSVLSEEFDDRWADFWSTFCPRIILDPTQHCLTDLTLHSDTLVGTFSGLSLSGLHFPHLCALSLRKIVFESPVGIEPFILRHTATLARLELLGCTLPTYAGLPFPLGSPPPPLPSACYWNSIWDRFAAELTALVALHVDEPECSYVSAHSLSSYLRTGRSESRDATDAEALQRFHVVVTARSEEMRKET